MAQVLFERDRSAAWISVMSTEFIIGVLLPAMESHVHHKAEAGAQAMEPCNMPGSENIRLHLCVLMFIAGQD